MTNTFSMKNINDNGRSVKFDLDSRLDRLRLADKRSAPAPKVPVNGNQIRRFGLHINGATQKARRAQVKAVIDPLDIDEEFEWPALAALFEQQKGYRYLAFRKGKSPPGFGQYEFQGLDEEGRWRKTSWRDVIAPPSPEREISDELRKMVFMQMRQYREFHPTCERCRLDYQVSTEVHHLQVKWHKNGSGQPGIADEIIEGLREWWPDLRAFTRQDGWQEELRKNLAWFPAWHKTLKLQAVCDDCHYELTRAGL